MALPRMPNEALAEMRELSALCDGTGDLNTRDTNRLVGLFMAMDEWLSGTGNLPDAWAGGHGD